MADIIMTKESKAQWDRFNKKVHNLKWGALGKLLSVPGYQEELIKSLKSTTVILPKSLSQ